MNFFDLAYTTPDVLEKIKTAEALGNFNSHLDPIDYSACLPLTADFPYIPPRRLKLKYFYLHISFLYAFTLLLNKRIFHTKIIGRSNLKNLKSAVVTCNHINKYDGLLMKYALHGKKLKIMTADFNNRNDLLGEYMRASGILPFSPAKDILPHFNKAVEYYLHHNTFVLFFPEGSEWWCYEKPRPFMDGAFHYTAANNVPVLPCFVTFSKTGKYDKNGIELRRFTVHILKPLYPDNALSKSENIRQLKEKNFAACMETYNSWYAQKAVD
ncbi:MAG: 1-acyl-sn-glycerol-3-phosphate acyltransferase [Bacteroides sp.]|nr:1-acyl-sn-glycerol-3-phosphate acyltransferase [Prevotella sp.]MCM1407542.1 1-acyl-sn-glycerol-3-phosphate acyltransferase [Treponema brennaborense]MCM1469308.1 1-acyl-sn-glycerol-3-phosphate acyltransferase [Bacteroides sp.]